MSALKRFGVLHTTTGRRRRSRFTRFLGPNGANVWRSHGLKCAFYDRF